MNLTEYENKIVRVTDRYGETFTGVAETFPSEYGMHELGREEAGVALNGFVIFESDIKRMEARPSLAIMRATETWQRAGTYYVRVQAMARKHRITLRREFDEHDTPETKYIVLTDDEFPVATARLYPLDEHSMMIGRVVVLPEYRRQGIGTMIVHACEEWAEELCCSKTVVESRDNKTAFYAKLGYEPTGEAIEGDTFRCIRMEKAL